MKRRISAGVLATVASLAATLGLGAVAGDGGTGRAGAQRAQRSRPRPQPNPCSPGTECAGAARYSVQVATQSDFASGR